MQQYYLDAIWSQPRGGTHIVWFGALMSDKRSTPPIASGNTSGPCTTCSAWSQGLMVRFVLTR